MIKLAVIGAGRMGNAHARVLKNRNDCKISGVFDTSKEVAKKFATEHSETRIYPSLAALAADSSIDGVLVCNYSDQHYATIVELLKAGKKNIFCEKALVNRLADGVDLLKRARAAKAKILVGHHRRHMPGNARLRQIIESGDLGRIRMLKVSYCHPGYSREWGEFFSDFERSGGVTLDMMSHIFDLLNWYFGLPVSACGRGIMFKRPMDKPMDYISGTLSYKNGIICNIDGSWQRHGVGYDKIEIYGDKACAIYDYGDRIQLYRKDEHTEISLPSPSVHAEQMNAFISMIRDGASPLVSLRDGFDSVRVALGLLTAAKTGKTFQY